MISSKSNLNALSKKSILTFIKFRNNFAIVVESFYHASFWIQSTKTTNKGQSGGVSELCRRGRREGTQSESSSAPVVFRTPGWKWTESPAGSYEPAR